jgi:hypothetical protein
MIPRLDGQQDLFWVKAMKSCLDDGTGWELGEMPKLGTSNANWIQFDHI